MATKVKMVVLKDSFLGAKGREFYSASLSQIAHLEETGTAKRVVEEPKEEVTEQQPVKEKKARKAK